MPDLENLPTFASSTHNAQVAAAHRRSHVEPTILLALVKGLADGDTKGEILSKMKPMNLDDSVAFVKAREIGKRDLLLLGEGPSSGQVNAVHVQGKCWRCGQEGHSGKAPASVRKMTCKAYNSKCLKCRQVGHYTKVCKKTVEKKTKEEHVTTNTVQIMHSTVSTADINLCQFSVSGRRSSTSRLSGSC